jgi:hypothetical protein
MGSLHRMEIKDELLYKRELNWKDRILLDIHESIKRNGLEPAVLFERIDIDHDKRIDRLEFEKMIRELGVTLTRAECEDLFSFVDKTNTGMLDYGRFLKIFQDAIRQASLIERQRNIQRRAAEIGQTSGITDGLRQVSAPARAEAKVPILELKLKNAAQKMEMLAQQLSRKELESKELMEKLDLRDEEIIRLSETHFVAQQKCRDLEQQASSCLPAEQSMALKNELQGLKL